MSATKRKSGFVSSANLLDQLDRQDEQIRMLRLQNADLHAQIRELRELTIPMIAADVLSHERNREAIQLRVDCLGETETDAHHTVLDQQTDEEYAEVRRESERMIKLITTDDE